ncbi:MAG TPA: trehalose-phosphatase, partial [bacterium]|nr:trehalose-phosphatase [bacterium]
MKYILAPQNAGALAQYAQTNVLLAFDYDGTLAPIVRDPAKAHMRARTKRALGRVALRYPTVVISGRARSDVAARLHAIPLVEILGNHGLEPSPDMARYAAAVRKWMPVLRHDLRGADGVTIENKKYSIAIHYRQAPLRRDAEREIHRSIDALCEDCRVVGGKCVLNLLPAGAPHKGEALERLRREQHAETVIFAGDDVTDEDVFGLERPGKLLGIRIGR